MKEEIPDEVKEILLHNNRRWRHSGLTDFVVGLKKGVIVVSLFRGRAMQAVCTHKRSKAYGIKIKTCRYRGKMYVIRIK